MDFFLSKLILFQTFSDIKQITSKCQKGIVLLFVLLVYLDGGKVNDGCRGTAEEEAMQMSFNITEICFKLLTCSNVSSLGKSTYTNIR